MNSAQNNKTMSEKTVILFQYINIYEKSFNDIKE